MSEWGRDPRGKDFPGELAVVAGIFPEMDRALSVFSSVGVEIVMTAKGAGQRRALVSSSRHGLMMLTPQSQAFSQTDDWSRQRGDRCEATIGGKWDSIRKIEWQRLCKVGAAEGECASRIVKVGVLCAVGCGQKIAITRMLDRFVAIALKFSVIID